MKLIFIPVLFLCLFLSCRKTLPDFIEIGNSKGVHIHSINQLTGDTKIDVNVDGIDDLEFTEHYGHSPQGTTDIITLHFLHSSISLAGVVAIDSIFASFDTAAWDFGPYHNVYFNTRYFFKRISITDSLISADNVFKYTAFNVNERLDASMEFKHEDFNLMDDEMGGGATLLYTKSDTSYYNNHVNDKVRPFPYPLHKEIFFGLKMNGNKTRLGWLKLEIKGGGETRIIESALQ